MRNVYNVDALDSHNEITTQQEREYQTLGRAIKDNESVKTQNNIAVNYLVRRAGGFDGETKKVFHNASLRANMVNGNNVLKVQSDTQVIKSINLGNEDQKDQEIKRMAGLYKPEGLKLLRNYLTAIASHRAAQTTHDDKKGFFSDSPKTQEEKQEEFKKRV